MTRTAILVTGLSYGDEGKGSTIDYLALKYNPHTIFRFNGGSQALHHVVRPDGTVHGFSQFGSGTFNPGVNTYLSRFTLVDPFFLKAESDALNNKGLVNSADRITVDRGCVVVTPFHRIMNQMIEISRKDDMHGTCGRGIGQAMKDWQLLRNDTLLVGDLLNRQSTYRKLRYLLSLKIDLAEQLLGADPNNPGLRRLFNELKGYHKQGDLERLAQRYCDLFKFSYFKLGDDDTLQEILNKDGVVLFEGAQGVLLDPRFGFPPHVTKTKTTFENADELLKAANYGGNVVKLGILRAYNTRHGVGPFVTGDWDLCDVMPEVHNKDNKWQQFFRVGHFDAVASRYAIKVCGGRRAFDGLVITCLDRLAALKTWNICDSYIHRKERCGFSLRNFFGFSMETGNIHTIKVQDRAHEIDAPYESTLGRQLFWCLPHYTSLKGESGDLHPSYETYLGMIEDRLRIPVVISSFGPTYEDKISNQTLC